MSRMPQKKMWMKGEEEKRGKKRRSMQPATDSFMHETPLLLLSNGYGIMHGGLHVPQVIQKLGSQVL